MAVVSICSPEAPSVDMSASLIREFVVKLLLVLIAFPVGHSLLSAVGAGAVD